MAVTFDTLNPTATIFQELKKEPSWWKRFKADPSLYIEIRKDNQINVYFEGGSIARIHYCSKHKVLQVFTHHKYLGLEESKPMYRECSSFIEDRIDDIISRVKTCYSQKSANGEAPSKESWSEKYIQGHLIISQRDIHLDSEFAYKSADTDIRIDLVNVIDGKVTFVELKRLDDGRMLKETDENPEVIAQMQPYSDFISQNKEAPLDYYQRVYDIKQELGLPVPTTRPQSINLIPELLIFNRWEKPHSARDTHRKRMESILEREGIRYSIIDQL